MRVLAYELVDLEYRAQKIAISQGCEHWLTWGKSADRILSDERRAREEKEHWERRRQDMEEIAEGARKQGVDPEKHYSWWEWIDGRPTGRMREGPDGPFRK